MNDFELDSVQIIIDLCVDDLCSFCLISSERLKKLLIDCKLKNEKMCKKMAKMIKDFVYLHCFDSSVYSMLFSLYRRCHHQNDANLFEIYLNSQHFELANYSLLICEQLQIKNLKFGAAIDKLWQLSFCKSPMQKLQILVFLQQAVIECIDEHRKETE